MPLGLSSYAAFRLWPQVDRSDRHRLAARNALYALVGHDEADRPPAGAAASHPHRHRSRRNASPRAASPIVADAAAGALRPARRRQTSARAKDRRQERRAGSRADRRGQGEAARAIRKVQPQMDYLDVIRAALPRDGLLVDELSQVGFASYFGYPVYEPRTYVSCGFQGTLGFGFQTALGVKAAHPDRAGRLDHRRRRLHVRRAGARHRRPIWHRPRHAAVQQQCRSAMSCATSASASAIA